MNRLVRLFLLSAMSTAPVLQAAEQRVQDLALDDHTVYSIPVSGARITTISFPSPISAIDGALVTIDGKTPGLFQVAHTKGTAYVSLRALAKDATTNLNVRWNNRTYAFELRESAEPWYSVVLRSAPEKSNRPPRPLTPPRLLGLIDKAKAFALLRTQQPDVVADVAYEDHRQQPVVSDCGEYEVRLTEAFRFPQDGATVFHLVIVNRSDNALEHTPEKLEVRVADRVFNPSITDLVSGIAPHESTVGYVVVSGGPAGGNDLSLKNEFSFVLSRRGPSVEINTPDGKDIEPPALPQ
ncbi:MAG: hypothetical protein H0X34_10075 [Chthoniobacterales bacterium]|nr:hypothetical protein [Chthoniobacterales bacterium]